MYENYTPLVKQTEALCIREQTEQMKLNKNQLWPRFKETCHIIYAPETKSDYWMVFPRRLNEGIDHIWLEFNPNDITTCKAWKFLAKECGIAKKVKDKDGTEKLEKGLRNINLSRFFQDKYNEMIRHYVASPCLEDWYLAMSENGEFCINDVVKDAYLPYKKYLTLYERRDEIVKAKLKCNGGECQYVYKFLKHMCNDNVEGLNAFLTVLGTKIRNPFCGPLPAVGFFSAEKGTGKGMLIGGIKLVLSDHDRYVKWSREDGKFSKSKEPPIMTHIDEVGRITDKLERQFKTDMSENHADFEHKYKRNMLVNNNNWYVFTSNIDEEDPDNNFSMDDDRRLFGFDCNEVIVGTTLLQNMQEAGYLQMEGNGVTVKFADHLRMLALQHIWRLEDKGEYQFPRQDAASMQRWSDKSFYKRYTTAWRTRGQKQQQAPNQSMKSMLYTAALHIDETWRAFTAKRGELGVRWKSGHLAEVLRDVCQMHDAMPLTNVSNDDLGRVLGRQLNLAVKAGILLPRTSEGYRIPEGGDDAFKDWLKSFANDND